MKILINFLIRTNNYAWRIVPAIIVEICVMCFTIFLAFKDTSDWITGFFYSTIISVVVLNFANGIYQNSIFGLASKFPMRYTNYVILGNNICGTFTAVTNIITLSASPNLRVAAIYYFICALSVLLLAVDTFLAIPINVSFSFFFVIKYFVLFLIFLIDYFIYIYFFYSVSIVFMSILKLKNLQKNLSVKNRLKLKISKRRLNRFHIGLYFQNVGNNV